LNVCGIEDVRQTEMPTADPLVPEPISFKVEIAVEKLKRYVTSYCSNTRRTDPSRT